jgi:cytochrome b subunit of formate dehydrogenase
MKIFLLGLACFVGAIGLAVVGNLIVVVSAGPTVAAGERAVIIAAILDIVLLVASGVVFWLFTKPLSLSARIGSTLALLLLVAIALVMVLLMTILMLNR